MAMGCQSLVGFVTQQNHNNCQNSSVQHCTQTDRLILMLDTVQFISSIKISATAGQTGLISFSF